MNTRRAKKQLHLDYIRLIFSNNLICQYLFNAKDSSLFSMLTSCKLINETVTLYIYKIRLLEKLNSLNIEKYIKPNEKELYEELKTKINESRNRDTFIEVLNFLIQNISKVSFASFLLTGHGFFDKRIFHSLNLEPITIYSIRFCLTRLSDRQRLTHYSAQNFAFAPAQ